ncbi:MAG: transcription factor S [Thaumarchaeota archaeon]|nr:transcription factor S [Nitrososphaerota archaeon]
MKFCPTCEAKLKNMGSGLQCPKCSYSEASEVVHPEKLEEGESQLNVFEENEGKETMPTIEKECEKCGHNEAVWWMLQTRSADEPTTQFYRCTKCRHTWRDYS